MVEIWAPTLNEVGVCIPTRTANVALPGEDDYLNTFTEDTRPTGEQAQIIIDQAVDTVRAAVSTVATALEPMARNAAKWRAAADIELAYPERNADANYYAQLDARAKLEWDRFLEAASSQGSSTSATSPVYAFPEPTWWGDRTDLT